LTQLDVRYLEGKESPYVFMDCSGLLWYAWRTAGVDMPRQALSQMDRHMRVERKDAIAGDIAGEGTHVQMYLGVGNAMVHAPFNRKTVRLKMMSEEQALRVVWANPSLIATYRL
jgi:cell wall-associated NlpC family hydrolase